MEQTATPDFLARLNAAIEQQLADPALNAPVLRINSDRLDFTETGADRAPVVEGVQSALSELG